MKDIWIISDTHFNHENILKFTDKHGNPTRRFENVAHMNNYMLERWNATIKPQDKVYHLGDVFFGSRLAMDDFLPKLHGKKRLIIGNHDVVYGDPRNNPLQKYFEKIYLWRHWADHALLLTHVPVHPSNLKESRFKDKEMVNVHGHTHQNGSPPGPYVSVCVEMIDYTPVHIDEVRGLMK